MSLRRRPFSRSPVLVLAAACAAIALGRPGHARDARATDRFDLRAHYTKYEYLVPMRDGVRLFTAVYAPKDATQTYPILLLRTPYGVGPYGVDRYPATLGPCDFFAQAGYIFVEQDVRGRALSEGAFVEQRPIRPTHATSAETDESTDAYDTVEWLLHHVSGHNGRVGLWGVSYPGSYAAAGMIDSHPAIRAVSPEAPVSDLYMSDDAYHGGAFMLAANFGFYTGFKPRDGPTLPPKQWPEFNYGTQDAYEYFLRLGPLAKAGPRFLGKRSELWDDQVNHPTYDAFWRERNLAPRLKRVHCAVLTVGGWFDAEDLAGPLAVYREVGRNNPGIENGLVMGPWAHGGWIDEDGRRLGAVDFGSATGVYFRERILFPFFERHLRGRSSGGGDHDGPGAAPVRVFETGTNLWRSYAAWPVPSAVRRTLYFRENGRLGYAAPAESRPAADDYDSDPSHPVPFIGYTALGVPSEYMLGDQRFAARRPDVLTYATEPLAEDVTVAGPVAPKLFVATSGTDADWVVKLIDVYPADLPTPADPAASINDEPPPPAVTLGGYQQLVRGEPFRGRFRHGFDHPEPFVPGRIEEVSFEMPDVNHTFRRGHRIMVQVQSSWFPLTDRNPQTFVDIPSARPEDYRKAAQQVFRSAAHPSGVELPILAHPAAAEVP